MNVLDFKKKKAAGQKISMITCYDYSFAKIIADSNIDCILVGDSLAMTMHGFSSTLPASMEMMVLHTAAVVRGAPNKFIVGDLPFMSYRKSLSENMTAVEGLMKAGAHAVKLEGAAGNLELITHIVESGVPVMGHIGLTPQSVNMLGGYKVQGKDTKSHDALLSQAQRLQDAGCFSLVLECVPAELAKQTTEMLDISTIGIGAGAETDGQVLVLQDLLGMNVDFKPKFVRKFLDGQKLILDAVNEYDKETKQKSFPNSDESF